MTDDQDDDTINLPSLAKVIKTGTTVWEPLRSAEVAVLEAADMWREAVRQAGTVYRLEGPAGELLAAIDARNFLLAKLPGSGNLGRSGQESTADGPGQTRCGDCGGLDGTHTTRECTAETEAMEQRERDQKANGFESDGPEQTDEPGEPCAYCVAFTVGSPATEHLVCGCAKPCGAERCNAQSYPEAECWDCGSPMWQDRFGGWHHSRGAKDHRARTDPYATDASSVSAQAEAGKGVDPNDCPGCHGVSGQVARHVPGCSNLPAGVA